MKTKIIRCFTMTALVFASIFTQEILANTPGCSSLKICTSEGAFVFTGMSYYGCDQSPEDMARGPLAAGSNWGTCETRSVKNGTQASWGVTSLPWYPAP